MARRRESKMVGLTYGTLPTRKAFIRRVSPKMRGGYPMELAGRDEIRAVTEAIDQGIDAHLEAVFFEQFRGAHGKFGLRIKDAGSLHTLLRRLLEQDQTEEQSERGEGPHDLAASIMYTLDYEWI